MSTNTKEVLAAAKSFTESNELVSYLHSMLTYYEQDLKTKIGFMRTRMDVLQNVVDGREGFGYQLRSDIGKLGSDLDVLQAQIFEMTCTLVIVLNTQCGLTLEW